MLQGATPDHGLQAHWREQPVLRNGMSVDVEDYFHVQAFADRIGREDWATHASRVRPNVERILAMFADHSVTATFFTLAWVAERNPDLVRQIVAAGHELASHGCEHVPAYNQTREQFRADVRRSKAVLEDLGGQAVRGYRAPSFSIVRSNLWAFGELEEAGYEYSSSVVPIRHDIYGLPEAPRHAFSPPDSRLLECPVTTLDVLGRRWSFGGGGHFRILPYRFFSWGMRQVNEAEGLPCFFYFHPWEIDPGQPRVADARLRSRLRHYTNLGTMEARLRRLLGEFRWDRYDRILGLETRPGRAGHDGGPSS